MNHTLEDHLNIIHTTEMGAQRIRRNLGLQESDICTWFRSMILSQDAFIEKCGKNWYVRANGCEMTVNASSYTVITAHRIRKKENEPAILEVQKKPERA